VNHSLDEVLIKIFHQLNHESLKDLHLAVDHRKVEADAARLFRRSYLAVSSSNVLEASVNTNFERVFPHPTTLILLSMAQY